MTLILVFLSLVFCHINFVFAEAPRQRAFGFELDPCGSDFYHNNGIHEMKPVGPGVVYDKDTHEKLFGGGIYKCSCRAIIICEGRPEIGEALGYYIKTNENSLQKDFERKPKISKWRIINWIHGLLSPVFNWAYVLPAGVYYTKSNKLECYRFIRP